MQTVSTGPVGPVRPPQGTPALTAAWFEEFDTRTFDEFKLGAQLHRDRIVTVNDAPEQHGTLLRMNAGTGLLRWSMDDLVRMGGAGIPTASILACGRRADTEAVLMQRFAEIHEPSSSTYSGGRQLVDSRLTNHRTLDSLRTIRHVIEKETIFVNALKVGMEASGSLRVLPTGGVFDAGSGPTNADQLRQLDDLIAAVQTRLKTPRRAA